MPKADAEKHKHLAYQLEKAQEQIAKMQERITAGDLTDEEMVEAQNCIADMMGKIQRLAEGHPTAPKKEEDDGPK